MSVVSGAMGSQAAGEAAETQAAASREASGVQLEMYQQSRQDQMPWLEVGEAALGYLIHPGGMLEKGPGDFEASDYYQQGLDQEEQAINRYLASRGQYASGKAGTALSQNALANMQRKLQKV